MPFKNPAGIYIHFPFCHKKCGFCDFYSQTTQYQDNYFQSIIKELELYNIEELKTLYHFNTLYIGGGTPSITDLKDLESFFNVLQKKKLLKDLKEVTIEVNPESITRQKLEFYKSLGINRVSIGVQSLEEKTLKKLGRLANLKQNVQAIIMVKELFTNYSLDLMYSVPEQDLCDELFTLATFKPPHISAYSLTLYPGTPFYVNKEKWQVPEEEDIENYKDINDFFTTLGYNHYEVSSYALQGFEALHNNHYWERNAYLGLGAGASGFIKNIRYKNEELALYNKALSENRKPVGEQELLTSKDFLLEDFLLKLRLKKPFSIEESLSYIEKTKQEKIYEYLLFLVENKKIGYNKNEKIIRTNLETWIFSDSIANGIAQILD